MSENLYPQPSPVALTRSDFVRCARAVRAGMVCLEAGGAFSKGRARGLTYRRRVRLALRRIILRVRYGLEGVEAHTSFATARGFAQILGLQKSATGAILKLLWQYGLIDRATPKLRRGASKTKSPTQGWSTVWWCPSHWCIGPTLREFYAEAAELGTELADSLPENHNRTEDSLTGVGSTPTSMFHPELKAQDFQNLTLVSSAFEKLSDDPLPIDSANRHARARSPVPVTRALPPADAIQRASQAAQQAIQNMGVRYERDPVHPEGADLDKVLSHRASPEVLARIRERQLQDLAPDPDFEARRARVLAETEAEIVRETARAPTPLPPDPTEPKLTSLEGALADLGRRIGLKPPNSPS